MLSIGEMIFFIGCGFITSFVSNVLGLGGGWLITPMLNFIGQPMPVAVATSLFSLIGSSVSSVGKHYTLKRFDARLSILLCFGSISGIQISSFILEKLPKKSISENLRWLFIIFLIAVLFSLLFESKRVHRQTNHRQRTLRSGPLQSILIVAIGSIAGIFGGLLGVGGGFIVAPLLIYVFHLPKQNVVASSALSILIASVSGTINYWQMGLIRFDYGCSLLIGSIFGGYWAAAVLTKFQDLHMKSLFIQSLILMIASLFLKQLNFGAAAKILVFFTAGSLFVRMILILLRARNKTS